MKQLLLLLTTVVVFTNSYSQQAEAQLLFEEAEAAFNKFMTLDCESNPQDCQTTLMEIAIKLDKVEKIVGPKPKTVYLSAMVQKGLYDLFDYSHLYDQEHGEKLFDIVISLRETANQYLKMKQNDEVDNRYREMRNIVVELEKYPKDKVAWQKEKEKNDLIEAAIAIKKEKKRQAFLAEVKEYDARKDQYYREIAPKIDAWDYKEGIKIGMDIEELKKTHKEWFKGHRVYSEGTYFYSTNRKSYKQNEVLEEIKWDKTGKIVYYEFRRMNDKEFGLGIDKIIKSIGQDIVPDVSASILVEYFKVVQSPYTNNIIYIETFLGDTRIIKCDSNFIGSSFFLFNDKKKVNSATDLGYFDRFNGIYHSEDKEYILEINHSDKIARLRIVGTNKNFYYALKEGSKNEFELLNAYKKDDEGNEYGDSEKFPYTVSIHFNIEEGTVKKIDSRSNSVELYKKDW